MAGGSVTGASGKKHNKKNKEQETLIRENINLNLVENIIELITERGILQ